MKDVFKLCQTIPTSNTTIDASLNNMIVSSHCVCLICQAKAKGNDVMELITDIQHIGHLIHEQAQISNKIDFITIQIKKEYADKEYNSRRTILICLIIAA